MNNQWHIVFDNDNKEYGNTDIYQQGFKFNGGACLDNTVIFGSCVSKSVEITLVNDGIERVGQWFSVTVNKGEETHTLGRYKVAEERLNNDRSSRVIKAYDKMRDIINTDYSAWFDSLEFPITLKAFVESFASNCGIVVDRINDLPNKDMVIQSKPIEPNGQLSGKQILSCAFELNGGFVRLNFDGHLEWFANYEIQGALVPMLTLYPGNDLFPYDIKGHSAEYKTFKAESHEDYVVQKVTKVQIRNDVNDIGGIIGDGNTYIIENNFLVYGKTTEELQSIGTNFLNGVSYIEFTPSNITLDWNFEDVIGKPIYVHSRHGDYFTFAMSVSINGTQGMMMTTSSSGEHIREQRANGIHESMLQLVGKTNKLTRDVSGLTSEIYDSSTGKSKFEQLATEISAKVEEVGGDSSFSWVLTSSGFSIKSRTKEVFKCDSSGIKIDGEIVGTSGTIGGFKIGTSSLTSGNSGSLLSPNGVYIGTDGISLGTTSATFKVTSSGELTIDNPSGSINLGNSSAKMALDKNGISFGASSYTTEITKDKIQINNTYIDKDTVHCAKYNSATTYYTDISGDEIELHGSSTGGYLKIASSSATWASGSNTYTVKDNSNNNLIGLSSGKITLGYANGTIAFFGQTGGVRQTINKCLSSATLSTLVTRFNSLLTALNTYGLIISTRES